MHFSLFLSCLSVIRAEENICVIFVVLNENKINLYIYSNIFHIHYYLIFPAGLGVGSTNSFFMNFLCQWWCHLSLCKNRDVLAGQMTGKFKEQQITLRPFPHWISTKMLLPNLCIWDTVLSEEQEWSFMDSLPFWKVASVDISNLSVLVLI